MNIEQQRAAFEAAHKQKFGHTPDKFTDGSYASARAQFGWDIWQAAVVLDQQGRGEPVAWGIFYQGVMQQGWAYNEAAANAIATEDYPDVKVEVKPLYLAPQPAEPMKLECPKCGVDRSKSPCPGNLMDCAFKGEAQQAGPMKVPSDDDIIGAVKVYGMACTNGITTASELELRLHDIRALLASYGSKS